MINHMAEVAQMLGVELEEVFKVTDDESGKYHNYYRFTEKKELKYQMTMLSGKQIQQGH